MALPEITVPHGTPAVLADGHAITEDDLYAPVAFTTGHTRSRRLYTVSERVVDVGWRVTDDQLAALDDWFEHVLDVGSRFFALQVQDEASAGLLWWKAKWVTPWTVTHTHGGGAYVRGQVRLFGEGSADGPVSSDLALSFAVALGAEAALEVEPPPLALAFTVALEQDLTLGRLAFRVALFNDVSLGPLSFAVPLEAA